MATPERILDRVRAIPPGFVRAYGDVSPGAPRRAGAVLFACDDPTVPWHRVVGGGGAGGPGGGPPPSIGAAAGSGSLTAPSPQAWPPATRPSFPQVAAAPSWPRTR
jgi:6-O-methylguanine DNA methyltransferase, DNA binding domain